MTKKVKVETFIDEINSKTPMTSYPTNKLVYKHIDEIWCFDLADMID